MWRAMACTLVWLTFGSVAAAESPPELGDVKWLRELKAALTESQRTGRPVLALFQEIPGCATCTSFGDGPLSHPLLVEAIESEFVPLAVYNNRAGADADVLARFREPAWNNPVIRFLDAQGRDVLPRRDGVYGTHAVADRLVAAIRAAGRPVPEYLQLFSDELNRGAAKATVATHCFWEGEARLGGLPGVTRTRAVFAGGGEAVEVTYDPTRLKPAAFAQVVDSRLLERGPMTVAPESDQKRNLRFSALRFVPVSVAQATRINATLAAGGDATRWLSPRQRILAGQIAVALARDAHALDGLQRPDRPEAMAGYQRQLSLRLALATRG